ncbi:hypothetical protein N7517_010288 [Penicillium concentricum]|uniref:Uncharacterized protein n=1 Tax=Penicillium concentricum TaxID=293559 RepID=A0A9W9RAI4_9EURO|nr:uncharacterized protein N7517_010288 [Penicillium concentricum]KAJ5355679.1 hypothetical protein N7517_010288 [Penicillium concentricum]
MEPLNSNPVPISHGQSNESNDPTPAPTDKDTPPRQSANQQRPLEPIPQILPSATLHRSGYILLLVLLYIFLAVFSWVVTCYLSFRPITTQHYDFWVKDSDSPSDEFKYGQGSSGWTYADVMALYQRNERWYRASRVMQSIVSVMTIPLTSAVCSSAAVIFLQRRQPSEGLSLRQAVTLADKGWSDIFTYIKTFSSGTNGLKRYGSSFLFLAMFANLLGSVISPLQQMFLSTEIIKTPTWPTKIWHLLDIPDQWESFLLPQSSMVLLLTREALATTTSTQRQAQLWQGTNVSCVINVTTGALLPSCNQGGATFGNMSRLENPFLAELPNDYNTGLIQQFLPRINSSTRYESISAEDYPEDCDKRKGAFSVNYGKENHDEAGRLTAWGLEACMPANVKNTPWNNTRDRQDFTEELYLNVTIVGQLSSRSLFKIALETTAGYFELPNYMNGQVAGPLLEKCPELSYGCGEHCEPEGTSGDGAPYNKVHRIDLKDYYTFEQLPNRGPLLTIAVALFGNGSSIQSRVAHSQNYTTNLASDPSTRNPISSSGCADVLPFAFFSLSDDGPSYSCTPSQDGGTDDPEVDNVIAEWLNTLFANDADIVKNVFDVAAFIANQAWMESSIDDESKNLEISFDMGSDTQIPVISRGGLILVSILLALEIFILLPLAVYAAIIPRWTSSLDSFTMMRIGAAVADKMPLLLGRETDKVDVLDQLPGYVGDQSEESDVIGKLGLGAQTPLAARRNKRFESYAGESEPLNGHQSKESQDSFDAASG